jgi:hypothetical protein
MNLRKILALGSVVLLMAALVLSGCMQLQVVKQQLRWTVFSVFWMPAS